MNYFERSQRRTRQFMMHELKNFLLDVSEFVVEETVEIFAGVGLFAATFLIVPFLLRAIG